MWHHTTVDMWIKVVCCFVYLLRVSLCEGQFGGDVEHDFLLPVDGVDGLRTCLTVRHIQATPEPAVIQAEWERGGDILKIS